MDPEISAGRGGRGRTSCSCIGERQGFIVPFSDSDASIFRVGGSTTGSGTGGRAGDAFADTAGEGVLEPDFLLRRPIFEEGVDFSFS
jgi:hypothetical protein